MTSSDQTRRRFAPVHIETTFQSVRKTAAVGPNSEPTPEPSPRSASPKNPEPRQQKGRFHPQLIETSRRAHRAGDFCPATRPTDKTDITPYTNHIYLAKSKPRRRRGDSSYDEATRHMLSSRRETEDDDVKEYLLQITAREAARQMEDAALAAFPNSRAREGGVAHFYFGESSGSDRSADGLRRRPDQEPRSRRKSSDLGLNWWHRHMQEHAQLLAHSRGDQDATTHSRDTLLTTDSDLDKMDLSLPPDPLWTTSGRDRQGSPSGATTPTPPTHDPASLAALYRGRNAGPGRPFGAMGLKPDNAELLLMRQADSPPMLGKDLTFRRCPSPKPTRLETDRPFAQQSRPRDRVRDAPGRPGLWRGYCCKSEANGSHAGNGVVRPSPPTSPPSGRPRLSVAQEPLTEEPRGLWTGGGGPVRDKPPGGTDERLRREKAERDDKILREFDDAFVTQVYNYLSLGHPATARPFDDELARISRVDLAELASRDDDVKAHVRAKDADHTRCPRWRALKIYIVEWARRHPDLDSLDPLAWGVGDRRGSWAI
ncbi:hypothetical protein XA68_16088 [Ophiocordyceps unilateralis]|uniref:Uncharacterized protein n=1 Tax=Ophiocordyceps unilateralis TaxID=268505 RepID=A0A2A9PLS5_OPHUN|nr:hypothetical protein XA68_16088 [Ophiocordyceps unilateralis]